LNLTQRLIVGSLLVSTVFVVLTVGSLDRRLRSRLRDESVTELLREARLVGAQWRTGLDADSLADAAGTALAHRVTLVANDGRVMGDSEFDEPALSRLENHAARPRSAMRSVRIADRRSGRVRRPATRRSTPRSGLEWESRECRFPPGPRS
jgi:hypothetical protein